MAEELITIDGALGEGGGQVLRSAVALSGVTGRSVRIVNVRAGRNPPGLKRQHRASVLAAAAACDGGARGAEVGSAEVEFHPGPPRGGDFRFAVGTAGSASLVLQAVLPILLAAPAPSTVTVEGGTHVEHAPPFEFLDLAFLPLLRRMGADVSLTLNRPGFYPAGGGSVTLAVRPAPLRPLHVGERGEVVRRRAVIHLCALPDDIADREARVIKRSTGWRDDEIEVRRTPDADAVGPGNAVTIEVESACTFGGKEGNDGRAGDPGQTITEVFSAFGRRGRRAESVAESAVREMKAYLAAPAPVGEHLADQLLLPLALAGGGSFATAPLTPHATTNAAVIRRFLSVAVGTTLNVEAGIVTAKVAPDDAP